MVSTDNTLFIAWSLLTIFDYRMVSWCPLIIVDHRMVSNDNILFIAWSLLMIFNYRMASADNI